MEISLYRGFVTLILPYKIVFISIFLMKIYEFQQCFSYLIFMKSNINKFYFTQRSREILQTGQIPSLSQAPCISLLNLRKLKSQPS